MSVKLRKYQRFSHFSIAWFAPVCNGRSRQGDEITCRQTTLTQRITTMAMKKKSKKKKAAKKS
jgi:hypothetical protein